MNASSSSSSISEYAYILFEQICHAYYGITHVILATLLTFFLHLFEAALDIATTIPEIPSLISKGLEGLNGPLYWYSVSGLVILSCWTIIYAKRFLEANRGFAAWLIVTSTSAIVCEFVYPEGGRRAVIFASTILCAATFFLSQRKQKTKEDTE